MMARWKGRIIALLVIATILIVGFSPRGSSTSQTYPQATSTSNSAPIVISSEKNDVAPLPKIKAPLSRLGRNVTALQPEEEPPLPMITGANQPVKPDTALQSTFGPTNAPSPIQNFDGISNGNNAPYGHLYVPPDTDGAVGPNHYVQIVNILWAVYSKTGTPLYGPAPINSIWSGFGGDCETHNNGDPVVLYDHFADRWLISQPAWNFWSGPFRQCIAISTSPDPTGTWNRYSFVISNTKMNDYPKFGVWPDGYYMSTNQFTSPTAHAGEGVVVFERSQMLLGLGARAVYFDTPDPNLGNMLPSDADGPAPPSGAPNYFAEFDTLPQDELQIWQFQVNWTTPTASTFTPLIVLATAPFNSNLCNYGPCIPQPGTSQTLDTLSDRLMYRLQYRNFGSYETLVVCHTVNVGSNQAGMRWYELRKTVSWSIYQQGTYAPDSNNRWMGSVAMDATGNIAMGYSVSSSIVYPSIRYTGRVATDPLGTMGTEAVLIAGSGSQTGTERWGDYSQMSVDPDGTTFWYTQEYYDSSSAYLWKTRIGSFQFTASITITSRPTGAGYVTVDSVPITTPQLFNWVVGSTHTLSASSTVSCGSGCQYVWGSWSDGGAQSHQVTTPSASTTYTAFFLGTSTISLSLSSGSISLGNSLTLSGTITPTQPSPGISTGTTVLLSLSTDGGSTWSVFLTTSTTSGGSYSNSWIPPYPGSYKLQASWSGDQNYAGATSSAASLSVTGASPAPVLLLVTGPSSASHGTIATFDVVVNQTSTTLRTTLYIDITGPGGYEYFDTLNVTQSGGSSGTYSFNWQIPNTIAPGTYQVTVGLIPSKAASFSQTQINVT